MGPRVRVCAATSVCGYVVYAARVYVLVYSEFVSRTLLAVLMSLAIRYL